MKITYRWIGAVLLSLAVVAATVHLVAGPSPPSAQEARQIASRHLALAPELITIDDSRQEGSLFVISSRVPAEGGGKERVVMKVEPTTSRLRYVCWEDRLVPDLEGPSVSKADAEKAANKLFSRFFPEVPVEMAQVMGKKLNLPIYMFGWAGKVEEAISSGDTASAQISSVTGKPISYMQRLAPERPDPADIRVSKDRAIEIAEKNLPGHYEHKIAPRCTKARLILSSPLADDEGPVWQLSFDVLFPDSPGTVDRTLVPVHAMSGKVL